MRTLIQESHFYPANECIYSWEVQLQMVYLSAQCIDVESLRRGSELLPRVHIGELEDARLHILPYLAWHDVSGGEFLIPIDCGLDVHRSGFFCQKMSAFNGSECGRPVFAVKEVVEHDRGNALGEIDFALDEVLNIKF